jgi:ribosomal protein S18 acetylase RimI-like enzyme
MPALQKAPMNVQKLSVVKDGERFYAAYRAYIAELSDYLRGYGNISGQPQPWWVNDPDSLVQVAWVDDHLAGFVINGWGRRVDADTTSEILEFYVAPAFRGKGVGRHLAALGLSRLFGQAGFQVYFDNQRAERFWQWVLAEHNVTYTTYPAVENNIPVIKYRFAGGARG